MRGGSAGRLVLGALAWLALFFAPVPAPAQRPVLLLVWAALLIAAPAALSRMRLPKEPESRLLLTASYIQPFAAVISGASFLISPGVLAGTLAIAWLPVAGLAALAGLRRALSRAGAGFEERLIDLASLMLFPGAVWLWASRLSMTPFGVTAEEGLLSALHFHYGGFAGTLLAGLAGRRLRQVDGAFSPLLALSGLLALAGPFLSQAGSHEIEVAGTLLLAAAYVVLALVNLFQVLPDVAGSFSRALLGLSSLCALVSMPAGAWFAALEASRRFAVPAGAQLLVHGWPTALFGILGLLGWAMESE